MQDPRPLISEIRKLKNTELNQDVIDRIDELTEFTGWYALDRLKPEGPYESIIFNENDHLYEPDKGPLAGTKTQWPWLWCAISEGRLQVADKKGFSTPPDCEDSTKIRGWYDVDTATNRMVWNSIDESWNENEIAEYRLLSNISYRLYNKVPASPRNILFFGAGASFGSDRQHLHKTNRLPPLGNGLFEKLKNDSELKYWQKLPAEIEEQFRNRSFEEAMEALGRVEEEKTYARARDLELSRFMGKYRPERSNLYRKLAFRIAHGLKTNAWSGAIASLNYECLLEESLRNAKVFPAVKGITYYDIDVEKHPPEDDQILEICYPHGACHLYVPQDTFVNFEEGLIFEEQGGIAGNTGACQILHPPHINEAIEKNYHPLIRRYQPSKRASVNSYFLDTQKERLAELILHAEKITIVGIQCLLQNDEHVWDPLAKTTATIAYVEPFESGQKAFRSWAQNCGKTEKIDFVIIGRKFQEAFSDILALNNLI